MTGVDQFAPSAALHAAPGTQGFVELTIQRNTGLAPGHEAVELGTPLSRRPNATYASAAASYAMDTAVSANPAKGMAGGVLGSAAEGANTRPSGDAAARTNRSPCVSDS